jgi:TrbL/VirB6 plasmid conjugal transfer protein
MSLPVSPPSSARRALLVLGALAAMLGLPGAGLTAVSARTGTAAPGAAVGARTLADNAAAHLGALAPASGGVTARGAGTVWGDASDRGGTAAPFAPMAPAQAVLTAVESPAHASAPGGVCQVPGIGDIGGLLGFCAAGSSGVIGDLNNVCQPSVPTPEPATGGIDALVKPPATAVGPSRTLYSSYGMAGQSWAAYDLQCSDMASLIGNNVAGVVFDAAKALDRVTITVYQSAAGSGILNWLTGSVDRLVSALGNAIYFPYLAPVVLLGAIWLAWQGLIRKRASRTIEGTLWMVVACAAAIWLIGRPADFTGFGKSVSDGVTQTLNVAFAKLPAPQQSSCVPVPSSDPQVPQVANFNYATGGGVVDTNANELWTVLVCKPWLDGEFGTTAYATSAAGHPTVVNTYARQLLWAQAIAANEKPTADVINAKQNTFAGIASAIKQNEPAVYPLFQGKQWTTRLEIAFASVFAALVAGVLVLLIAITLIILKLGFLLLLIAGPFFLIVGTHPGFGRVIAVRWAELLIGVLLKQGAVALVLSVLLYAYTLIMGASDAVLPWALKILMISLVTVAVFIYRKPFVHLFSAVGYGAVGSRERAELALARAGSGAARNTVDAATVGVPGFAAYRVARWARRNPAQAASLAAQFGTAGATGTLAGAATGAAGSGSGPGMNGEPAAAEAGPDGDSPPANSGSAVRGRARPSGTPATGRTPPPLDLPPRQGEETPRPLSGWARGGSRAAARAGGVGPAGSGVPAGGPAGNGAASGSGARPGSPPQRRPAWPGPAAGSGQRDAGPQPRPAPARTPSPGAGADGPLASAARGTATQSGRHAGPSAGHQAVPPIGQSAVTGDGAGQGGDGSASRPFWLRPRRRK